MKKFFKKLKRFYKEHRIFIILMSVVLVCLIVIGGIAINFFHNGNGDKYGARLEEMEKYGSKLVDLDSYEILPSRKSDFEKNMVNTKKVKKCNITVTGRIVYITMQFEESVDLVEAKSIALKSLESFSEDEKKYFDFDFTIKKNTTDKVEGFLVSGAFNKNGSGLIWNNNRDTTKTEQKVDNSTEKDE